MSARIGAVLVTHGNLGKSLLDTCEMITGPIRGITHVSISARDDVEEVRKNITKAINDVRGPDGTLLLVDMFGGTPSNIGITFLEPEQVEVVTGVNLPMLTKLTNLDPNLTLRETASIMRKYGSEHIKVASEYLSET